MEKTHQQIAYINITINKKYACLWFAW